MKILINGHSSMIGRRLAQRLSEAHDVATMGRRAGATFVFDMVGGNSSVPEVGRQDVIIHCAASFNSDSVDGFIANELVNAIGALRMAQIAAASRTSHLIYLSTIFSSDHPNNQYFGSYGLSKRHGKENLEQVCRVLDIGLTTLNLSQVYDESGEAAKHQPFLYKLVSAARSGMDFTIFGKSDPERNYIFVDDVVNIIERVVNERLLGEFSCVFPRSYLISEIAAIAYEVFGCGGQARFDSSKPSLKSTHIPADYRLYDQLGYHPDIDLRTGLMRIRNADVAR